MPTIAVDKADLWDRLGKEHTYDEFDKLCFDYGLELDEDASPIELTTSAGTYSAYPQTTDAVEEAIAQGLPAERPQLKIEIPANRYDLLCIEGISRALNVFLGREQPPRYKLVLPPGGEQELIHVTITPETKKIRPLFACAVLRNVTFTQRSYASFIDLQDKLHQNICRRRQLVSIGTHDLDTLQAPFTYDAQPPKDIKFIPLGKGKAYDAQELMTVYESEKHLSQYLHIIKDSPVFPILYDKNKTVLSMPPIINSEHSKITLNTRNIFIDVTATDETKLGIVVNMVATMFAEYSSEKYAIEPVKVTYPDGQTRITPDISERQTVAHASYVNSCTGLNLSVEDLGRLLQKMSLYTHLETKSDDEVAVGIPATRPDILHECDIMEDAAIAYGFNNLPNTFPATTTVGRPSTIGQLTDVVRREWALAGWTEVLALTLCSHNENFSWLNHSDDGTQAVRIGNPKTQEYEVVRTTLLPGLLKTIRENRSHPLPISIFEIGDIVVKDKSQERQTRNIRHAGAVWCNKTAGFEVVHGLLDRAMKMLEVPRIQSSDTAATHGYYLKESDDPAYLPGRGATIHYRPLPETQSKISEIRHEVEAILHTTPLHDIKLGSLGILHPSVLEKFGIGYPCSAVEFTIEPFKKKVHAFWMNGE